LTGSAGLKRLSDKKAMAEDAASHLVLARKWRPGRLEDLVGQEHVTRTLRRALTSKRVAHAFLFCGIHGVGKTSAARILARCLNCVNGPTCDPCGRCQPCIEISEGRSLDVVEIDGATYRKIDDARAIIENLAYRPARDRYKVYIIDEAHQLTDQAFNALLKTLEEPPAHVKFILATTEPQKMPETILSRLQRYDFRRIPSAQIVARLSDLARRETIAVEEGALALIAREAGGSMRDAERMLETALAMASEGVRESEVAAALGVASRTRVLALIETILNCSPAPALSAVRQAYADGARVESLGRDLLDMLRNLALAKLAATDSSESLLEGLPDREAAELSRLAQSSSLRNIVRLFRLMVQAQEEILRSPYPELLLEMAVVRMATLAPVLDAEELMRAIDAAQSKRLCAAQGARAGALHARSGQSASPPPRGAVQAVLDPAAAGAQVLLDSPQTQADPLPTSQSPARANEPVGTAPDSDSETPARPAHDLNQRPGVRLLKVEGEVKADAPLRVTSAQPACDLPELREHIRARKGALAGFMEHGASLHLEGNMLTLTARSDIYVRYFQDHIKTLAELASDFYQRPIAVRVRGGAPALDTTSAATTAASRELQPPAHEQAHNVKTALKNIGAGEAGRSDRESKSAALKDDPLVRMIFDQLDARLLGVRSGTRQVEVDPTTPEELEVKEPPKSD
jgi:DNA polymerase-3 subunit gamma/tau